MSDMKKLKQLRAETDVSYAMCKKALDDANGDLDKARQLLKEKGAEVAAKKADRATDQGSLFSYIHHNNKLGAMIVLLCETDFVAKNDGFQKLGNDIAMHVASTGPKNTESLLTEPFIKDPKTTVGDLIQGQILKLGENITLSEFTRYEI